MPLWLQSPWALWAFIRTGPFQAESLAAAAAAATTLEPPPQLELLAVAAELLELLFVQRC